MKIITLFVRPSYDDVTSYLYFYSKELIQFSSSKGYNVLNKEKNKANYSEINNIISNKNPKFIMFNGHGSENSISGHNDEILVKLGDNHKILKEKIIYSLSCSSAKELGRKSVEDGTLSFIGYDDDFALGMDLNCQSSIYRDKRAKLFLEPSNLLVKSILKGNTIGDSVQKSKEAIKKNISLLKIDSSPDSVDYLPYLTHNYLCLTFHGEGEIFI